MKIQQIKIKPGVYLIYDSIERKCYIGSSQNIRRRICCHFSMLKRNKHECAEMQKCFNKNDKFNFRVLQYLKKPDKETLLACEQKWITRFYDNGRKLFNKALKPTQGVFGCKHPYESLIKHSRIGKANWENQFLRKRMCEKIKESWKIPEIREKKCKAIKEGCQDLELKRKRAINAKKQWQNTEHHQKMSDIKKGDKNPNCKLKSYMIEEIKKLYYKKKHKIKDIAKLYNVHPETMRIFIQKYM